MRHSVINCMMIILISISTAGCSVLRLANIRSEVGKTETRQTELSRRDLQLGFNATGNRLSIQLQYVPYYKVEQTETVTYRSQITALDLGVGLASLGLLYWATSQNRVWDGHYVPSENEWVKNTKFDLWNGADSVKKAVMIGVPADWMLSWIIGGLGNRTVHKPWKPTGAEVVGTPEWLKDHPYRIALPAYDFSKQYRSTSGQEFIAIREFMAGIPNLSPFRSIGTLSLQTSTKVDGKPYQKTLTLTDQASLKPFHDFARAAALSDTQAAADTSSRRSPLQINTQGNRTATADNKRTVQARKPANLPPILSIEEVTFSEAVLDAEETATLSIRIKNTGPGDANDLTLQLAGELTDLFFPSSTPVPTIPKDGGEKTVNINIRGGFHLPTATASIDIRLIEPHFDLGIGGKRLTFGTRAFLNPVLVLADAVVQENPRTDPNNRIDLRELIDLKFYVQNRGEGTAEQVKVEVETEQTGVLWLGVADKAGNLGNAAFPIFSRIDAGQYELITFTYILNNAFTDSELRFKIRVTEQRGTYGFDETKVVAIQTQLEELEEIQPIIRADAETPRQSVQIEELPPLEIDVRKNIPLAVQPNPDAVAVVIGIQNYRKETVPPVDYAKRDAQFIREYLIKTFGYDEANILPRDPNTTLTVGTFKTLIRRQLPAFVKKGKSDVFIYYSGHGAPSMDTNEAFLVPYDCDPDFVDVDSAYQLREFYEDLKKIESRSLTVILDTCFSGLTGNGKSLIQKASPLHLPPLEIPTNPLLDRPGSLVITSTSNDKVSNWYPDKEHSLFTYFFLKGIQGAADRNDDKRITAAELETYLLDVDDGVPYWSNRLFLRRQTPEVHTKNKNHVIATFQ